MKIFKHKATADFLAFVVSNIMQILMLKIIGMFVRWRKNREDYDKIELKSILFLILCPIVSIIILHNNFLTASHADEGLASTTLLSSFGILYMNFIIFWYLDRIKTEYDYKREKELAETMYELQKNYYQLLEQHQEEIGAMWHDIKKHMSAIKALHKMDLKPTAENYTAILDESIKEIPKIIRTTVPEISAILVHGFQMAKKENIRIQLDINISTKIKVNSLDLCILLGNTIDNAINACSNLSNVIERLIDIKILQCDELFLIEVRNPFDLTNNAKAKKERGYGLKNVRRVVQKYNGDIKIQQLDNEFHVSLIIP